MPEDQNPPPPPSSFRRHAIWGIVGVGLALLGIWGGFAASMAVGRPMTLALVGPISVLLFFGGLMLPIALWQRDLRRVRTCQGHVCLHCLYDVRSLPAEGRCPECGTPYIKSNLVRKWRHADRSYKAKKLYVLDEDERND